jgi:flagellar motor switch protein FliN/FliY
VSLFRPHDRPTANTLIPRENTATQGASIPWHAACFEGFAPWQVTSGTDMNETTLDELDSATDATLASSIGLGNEVNLDVILDVPVTMAMEVGRTRISIRNLLQLNQGSVVELDRAAGEPLDVFVNGTLVAHGEVVVINEKFGIRLTDVISPAERVRKLR